MKESDNYDVIDEAKDMEPGDVYGGDQEDIDTFFDGIDFETSHLIISVPSATHYGTVNCIM